MSSEETIAREVAEQEFERWAAAMRLGRKLDPSKLDDEDKKGLTIVKGTLLDAIQDRLLVVDSEGRFVLSSTTNKGTPFSLTFNKPKGVDVMAIDQAKPDEGVKKTVRFLASVTGQNAPFFSTIDLADFQICDAIATLFLAR